MVKLQVKPEWSFVSDHRSWAMGTRELIILFSTFVCVRNLHDKSISLNAAKSFKEKEKKKVQGQSAVGP